MKVAITGHKGFVGQHLTKYCNSKDIEWSGFDIKEGDCLTDKRKLDTFFEKEQPTKVIHLAALAGVRRSEDYPDDYIETNCSGTKNLVDICEKYNTEHIVFFSSSSVYGDTEPPVKETDDKYPLSLYGCTKLFGERLVQASSLKTSIIRPFTVYGENGRKDEVVYKWIQQIKAGKPITVYIDKDKYGKEGATSKRGYVYVKDLVKTTVDCLNREGEDNESYNLGGAEVIELKELVDVFENQVDDLEVKYLDRPDYDIKSNFADSSKAKKELGFDPEPKFKTRVRNIISQEL